ncbi:MAG: YcjX family protein [Fimbriimonadaceae bacterium]|nr:YcjX family protein [Alphaproteobacteria bacterium]
MNLTDIWDETRNALGGIAAYASDLVEPTVRLGVTGLSNAGKTIFITSLVRNLTGGGTTMPALDVAGEGRLIRAYLQPQPDDSVPRFDYERHLNAILQDRTWPESTRRISQLRLTLEFEPVGFWGRNVRGGRLNVDIVDYPGEWLLDLPLLNWSFADWSARTLETSERSPRDKLAKEWHSHIASLDPAGSANEADARKAAELFTEYLRRCRDEKFSFSALPPGRFLMPGDLEGSPALTFAPLPPHFRQPGIRNSLYAMMERRFESYKTVVVKPFFRDHFARLDRQIVLVDALSALNAGPEALHDLETALTDILTCFRPGANSWLSAILNRRVERILIAATKADHLHRDSHDLLEAIVRRLTQHAIERAEFSGAQVQALALASIRATREATADHSGDVLKCIVGTPLEGEKIGKKTFNGNEETAIFPGDLPKNPDKAIEEGWSAAGSQETDMRFIRFRPPLPQSGLAGQPLLPHIRLDRAVNFLIGDYLN